MSSDLKRFRGYQGMVAGRTTTKTQTDLRAGLTCPECGHGYPIRHTDGCGLHIPIKDALPPISLCGNCKDRGQSGTVAENVCDCRKCGLRCRSVSQIDFSALKWDGSFLS